jgi:hypothetical protein
MTLCRLSASPPPASPWREKMSMGSRAQTTSSSTSFVQKFNERFACKDLGDLQQYIGLEVTRDEFGTH